MIAPPGSLRTDDSIAQYYRNAVEAIGADVPFVIQDYPLAFSVQMSPTVIRRIVTENPSCAVLKHEDWPGLEKISALRAWEKDGSMRRDEAHDLLDAHLPLIRYERAAGSGPRGSQVHHEEARGHRLGRDAQALLSAHSDGARGGRVLACEAGKKGSARRGLMAVFCPVTQQWRGLLSKTGSIAGSTVASGPPRLTVPVWRAACPSRRCRSPAPRRRSRRLAVDQQRGRAFEHIARNDCADTICRSHRDRQNRVASSPVRCFRAEQHCL